MRTVILALALAAAMSATAYADHLPPLKLPEGFGTRVEAGRSVGNLRIGMPLSDARVVLGRVGELTEISFRENRRICVKAVTDLCVADFWKYGDEEDAASTPGRVIVINTEDTAFRTSTGLGVQSRPSAFVLLYGSPEFESVIFMEWWKSGIAIVAGRGRVDAIYVVKPR